MLQFADKVEVQCMWLSYYF